MAIITGSVVLGILEAIIHAATDWLKCENRISLNADQAIHIVCKFAWAAIAAYGGIAA